MVRNQIKAVVEQLNSQPTFLYGTKNELNLLADKAQFPVVMLYNLKPITIETTISNAVNSTYDLYMEFLAITDFDEYTNDNETIVQTMGHLLKEFLVKLEYYRMSPNRPRYFRQTVGQKYRSLPVYNKLDVNSTGVSLSITLETMEDTNYDPNSRPMGYVPDPVFN